MMRRVSLYVHVPFCRRRCPYCTFYHETDMDPGLEDSYIEALAREFEHAAGGFGGPFTIPTVYIGGGTPSVLRRDSLERIFGLFAKHIPGGFAEVTFELNPEDVTDDLIGGIGALGVNRVSVGVQSMGGTSQRTLGRCAPEVNERAVARVEASFANFNVDLLLGIPGRTKQQLIRTLDRVGRLDPPHLSVYCLEPGGVVETGTEPFFERVDQEQSADEYLFVCDQLGEWGYHHYEISNFAIPGYESRHNLVYWGDAEYLGIGPGAHSFLEGERYSNAASVHEYVASPAAPQGTVQTHDRRDSTQRRLEKIMLSLRTSAGITVNNLGAKESIIDDLIGEGLARVESDRFILSERGFLVLNEIIHRLSGE